MDFRAVLVPKKHLMILADKQESIVQLSSGQAFIIKK